MYESFGFSHAASGEQSIALFIPDNTVDSSQYSRGAACNIADLSIIGDFQHLVTFGVADWDQAAALPMTQSPHPNGYLFAYIFDPPLPDGYYQYQYVVRFNNGTVRVVGDPCTKYGGDSLDRSAFVVGGTPAEAAPINTRLPSDELIIYELMIDDFTKEYRGVRAPIDAVADKLDLVQALNINAIEFLPWIAWPDDVGFSWGYNPAYCFSVESAYVSDAAEPLDRLSRLAALISECHRRKIHVLLDIVLQHVYQGSGTNGFPYYWLWQTPTDSPFTGQFVPADDFGMLPVDYTNACTQQFVADVGTYWLSRFKLDGFRFDQVTGFNNPQYPRKGAPELIAELKSYAAEQNLDNISLILEDAWDFSVVPDANTIQPTGAWFDVFRSYPFDIFNGFAVKGAINTSYMRVLNSALGFNAPICPTIYLENHDHATITYELGSRDRWFKAQPYMIALATCSGTVLLHNGQEWGQLEDLWEEDTNAPPQFKRVQSRPLLWEQRSDPIGVQLTSLYGFLMGLRAAHPALHSPNFYPNYYDAGWTQFSPDGYGINEALQVAIYHRWDGGDLYMIVLNFSDSTQYANVPLPQNGTWIDLLNGSAPYTTANYQLAGFAVQSNWGSILHFGS
ncbi:MAG: alpha-amylase family glycosyl hydrolase [Terracidiphilus sp.]